MKRYTSLNSAIRDIFGEDTNIKERRPVFGGDINEAWAVILDHGETLFMKTNAPSFLSNFEAEEEGLEAIRDTRAIQVPKVLGLGTDRNFSFLLMEYLVPAGQREDYWERFAGDLAAMHQSPVEESFGFSKDNWIGAGKQINHPRDSWIRFFRDCRLIPQLTAAEAYLDTSDRRMAEYLLSHLDRYLFEPERPSLIHGDLWSGNLITGPDGKGWLIDPAVYRGHPEADLAMTELFGGFPSRFYRTYREIACLEPGYDDRRDLYNLYHLLNHLNLFGSGYLGSVKRVLKRYAG